MPITAKIQIQAATVAGAFFGREAAELDRFAAAIEDDFCRFGEVERGAGRGRGRDRD